MNFSKIKEIYTEETHYEMWQMIMYYSYTDNISNYFKNKAITINHKDPQKLFEIISGSLNQAKEYFESSTKVSLYTSPLLLYYGISNLLYGFACLLRGEEVDIKSHGMHLEINDENYNDALGNIQFSIYGEHKGAIYNFVRIFEGTNITQLERWTLKEIFSSILELKNDFENCYEEDYSHAVPIERIKINNYEIERVDKSNLKYLDLAEEMFDEIIKFDENYLEVESTNQFYILRKKLNYTDIGCYTNNGQKYLQLSFKKSKSVTHNPLIYLFMGSFAIGNLSRYFPGYWNEFVRNDKRGERLLVEKFMYLCRRYIPNEMLNIIKNTRIIFVKDNQMVIDISSREAKSGQIIRGRE